MCLLRVEDEVYKMSSSKDELIVQLKKSLSLLEDLEAKKSKHMQIFQLFEGLNDPEEVLLLQQIEKANIKIHEIQNQVKILQNQLQSLVVDTKEEEQEFVTVHVSEEMKE